MDKNYKLIHLVPKVLRSRRLELRLDQKMVSENTGLMVSTIENNQYVHITDVTILCKHYGWSLSQFFGSVEFLDKIQKMS